MEEGWKKKEVCLKRGLEDRRIRPPRSQGVGSGWAGEKGENSLIRAALNEALRDCASRRMAATAVPPVIRRHSLCDGKNHVLAFKAFKTLVS